MKKINVAVIGLGVGYYHSLNVTEHKSYNLKIVCDLDYKKLVNFKKKYKNVIITKKVNDIFKDDSIKLVCIANYDNDHYSIIKKCIDNDKHIFIEKPICTKFIDYVRMNNDLKKKKNIKISSNFVLRTHPSIIYLKKILSKKILGKIYYMEGDYNYGRKNKIVNGWRSEQKNYSIFLGGGLHLLDVILNLTNYKDIKFFKKYSNKICTESSKFKYQDFELLSLKFNDNCIAKISSNFGCVFPHSHFFKIYGTKGTFMFDHLRQIFVKKDKKKIIVQKKKIFFNKNKKKLVLKSFLDSIVDKTKKPIVSKSDVLKITKISTKLNEN